MTRKDFEMIARTIKRYAPELRMSLAGDFANALAGTNANFDRDKFLRACGVQP